MRNMLFQRKLLAKIKRTVKKVDANAQVILYGSRARGDASPDSDWDVLILLSSPMTWEREMSLRHEIYQLERDNQAVFSTIVETLAAWNSEINRYSPFYQNVTQEGMVL